MRWTPLAIALPLAAIGGLLLLLQSCRSASCAASPAAAAAACAPGLERCRTSATATGTRSGSGSGSGSAASPLLRCGLLLAIVSEDTAAGALQREAARATWLRWGERARSKGSTTVCHRFYVVASDAAHAVADGHQPDVVLLRKRTPHEASWSARRLVRMLEHARSTLRFTHLMRVAPDAFVRLDLLLDRVLPALPTHQLMWGRLRNSRIAPVRNELAEALWPSRMWLQDPRLTYPLYADGGAFLLTSDVIDYVRGMALRFPLLGADGSADTLDTTTLGVWLAPLRITRHWANDRFGASPCDWAAFFECKDDMLVLHQVEPRPQKQLETYSRLFAGANREALCGALARGNWRVRKWVVRSGRNDAAPTKDSYFSKSLAQWRDKGAIKTRPAGSRLPPCG